MDAKDPLVVSNTDSAYPSSSSSSCVSSPTSAQTKKIIDFESLERYTECAFCLEQFKEPRILPCSHTYCTECIKRMSNNQKNAIKCAQCLAEHTLQTEFPINLVLQQLLDIRPTQLISSNECDECRKNFAFTKCFHCTKFICLECNRQHRNTFKLDLNHLFNLLITKCNFIIDKINADINEFLLDCNKTKLNITNCVDMIVNNLKIKEAKLHEDIDAIINEKMSQFDEVKLEISKQSTSLKVFLEQSGKSIKEDSVSDDELFKFKNESEHKFESLIKIEKSSLNKKFHVNFEQSRLIDVDNLIPQIGTIRLNEYEETQSIASSSRSSSTCSLSTVTPPHTPKKSPILPRKTNLDCIKEKGYWAGSEHVEFWCPSGVCMNPCRNEIIIADSWNHRLQIRTADNAQTSETIVSANGKSSDAQGEFNNPKDVCADVAKRRLIVSDSGNSRVQIFDLDSYKFLSSFGRYGFGQAEFRNQIGVCVDGQSQIYVCDRGNHRVQVFDSQGVWLKELGARGNSNGQFEYPEYICISPVNYLLVSDTCNNRVQIFDLDNFNVNSAKFGGFIAQFGGYGVDVGLFRSPRGITTDSDGFIMVADCKNNRLQLFEPNGEFVREINETCSDEFDCDVCFDRPVAICTTLNGALLVTEHGRAHRVQIF